MQQSPREPDGLSDDIRYILTSALLAPSGDNSQPWHWVVRGDTLELWQVPDESPKAISVNRVGDVPSYIGLGAAIENAVIAASSRGYLATVAYAPDPAQPMLAATLVLSRDAQGAPDRLAAFLEKRETNRKRYARTLLSFDERAALVSANGDGAWGEVRLLDDRPSINTLAAAASLHDELIFTTKVMHDFLFSRINWTKREDARKRTGFYFPTLAAPPFTWGAMQLLRHWWILRIGIALGLHRYIVAEQRSVYRRAAAYGIVISRGRSPADVMRAGRLIERTWLAATAAGLSFQPLTGVIYLADLLETKVGRHVFSPHQQQRIKDAAAEIARAFGAEEETVVFLFRTGHGKPPSSRTSRRPFEHMVSVAASADATV